MSCSQKLIRRISRQRKQPETLRESYNVAPTHVMPIIRPRGPPELAAEMMKPYGGAIEVWEVGKDVGNVRNNKPDLLDRVALI